MKKLITLFITLSTTIVLGQSNLDPQKGTTLSFGIHSAVPTENILFHNIRQNTNPEIVQQPLLQEWYSPKLGGYVDFLSRINTNWVSFIGFQYNWQTLYSSTIPITSTVEGFEEMGEHYRLTKLARLSNFILYSDNRVANWKRLNIYLRGELGLANYTMRNYFHTSGSRKRISNYLVDNSFQLNTSLSLGGALSFRYQFNELFALNLLAGYRFNTANHFIRRPYISGIQGEMNSHTPGKYTYEIKEGTNFYRPQRPKNEYLFLQFGIVRRLNFTNDGRNFSHKRVETGEPTRDPATVAEKPILYLYPEDTTTVNVSIDLTNHEFIFTYPTYPSDGWEVVASPSGNLYDVNTKRNYYSLFWETEGVPISTGLTEGFVVKGKETREFLEEKLAYLGLNEHEANEFLIYWLPKMETNPYNAIHFSYEDYEAISKLNISPKPETLIRIMLLFTPLEEPIQLTPQQLNPAPERKGFTAVEWGGMEGDFFLE